MSLLRKSALVLLFVLGGMFAGATQATAAPTPPAPASKPACASIPIPTIWAICNIPNIDKAVGKAAGTLEGAAGSVAGNVAEVWLKAWSFPAREASQFVYPLVVKAVTSAPKPNVASTDIYGGYQKMFALSLTLISTVFLLRLATSRGSPRRLLDLFVNTFKAVLFCLLAPVVVQTAIVITDGLNASVISGMGTSGANMSETVAKLISLQVGPTAAVFLTTWLLAATGWAFFIELIMRTATIYIAFLLAPLAFAGVTLGDWGATWLRRLSTLMFSVIAALPISSAVLVIGTNIAVSEPNDNAFQKMSNLILGCCFVVLAVLVPIALFVFAPTMVASVRNSFSDRDEPVSSPQEGSATTGPTLTRSIIERVSTPVIGAAPAAAMVAGGGPAGMATAALVQRISSRSTTDSSHQISATAHVEHLESQGSVDTSSEVSQSHESRHDSGSNSQDARVSETASDIFETLTKGPPPAPRKETRG